jgi:hypothetical protein
MWLQPNSPAIRRTPHPSAFSRSIAITSSGVCITSLRGNSPRGTACTDSSIPQTLLVSDGVHLSMSPTVQFHLSPDSSLADYAAYMQPGSSIDDVLQGPGYPAPITPASLVPNDNFTKMKKQYAEMGLGRSNTRFGWMRTRG